jgi:putative transposase
LVDTQGFVLKVLVHPANLTDSEGGKLLLQGLQKEFPRLAHVWADGGYFRTFVDWLYKELGWTVEVVKRPHKIHGDYAALVRDFIGDEAYAQRYAPGFKVLPWRWIVERTFAWLGKKRRLSKDYELLPTTTETWIYLCMVRLMLRRLVATS